MNIYMEGNIFEYEGETECSKVPCLFLYRQGKGQENRKKMLFTVELKND